jgi:outer membrane murein-binding lipoprotein Lpp
MKKSLAAVLLVIIIAVLVALALYFSRQGGESKKTTPPLNARHEQQEQDESNPFNLFKGPIPTISSASDKEFDDLKAQVKALNSRISSLEADKKRNSPVIQKARETFNIPIETAGAAQSDADNAAMETAQGTENPSAESGAEPQAAPSAGTLTKEGISNSVAEIFKTDEAKKAVLDIIHKEQTRQQIQRNFGSKDEFKKKLSGAVEWAAKEFDFSETQKIGTSSAIDRFVERLSTAADEAMEQGDYDAFRAKQDTYEKELRNDIIDLLDHDQLEKVKKADPYGFGKQIEERGM